MSNIKWRFPKDCVVVEHPINGSGGRYRKVWTDNNKYTPHDGPQACERRIRQLKDGTISNYPGQRACDMGSS